jgi:hypothetical protein
MDKILKILTVAVYFVLGIVCLKMAFKSIFSKKYLPFHEEAADKQWDQIENRLQYLILALLRISGLGFLIVFLILTVLPVFNYFIPDPFFRYFVPGISFIFCLGLFIFNFLLFKQTKAKTPWIGSLVVMIIIVMNFILSFLLIS